jgi:hypothetical protein
MLRLEDPTDNHGVGWRRLSDGELIGLLYIAIRLTRRGVRRDFHGVDASKADAAVKIIAKQIVERLRHYPVFGPARPAQGPTCGASGISPDRSCSPNLEK